MSNLPPIPVSDASLAMREAAQNDLIRRKQDMDALRKRLGDQSTKQEKLRDACEGFEAIFIQKMWEQMRKNVPKEGYLHSKDEEAYQSLFDVELCKKMASAGGIGLADMIYEQLSQQLENTGRTTRPGAYRQFLPVPPAHSMMAEARNQESPAETLALAPDKKLTAEDLYTPLEREQSEAQPEARGEPQRTGEAAVLGALNELEQELGAAPKDAPGAAVRDWAAARAAATGERPAPAPSTEARMDAATPGTVRQTAAESFARNESFAVRSNQETALPGRQAAQSGPAAVQANAAAPQANTAAAQANTAAAQANTAQGMDGLPSSWKGPGPVSAKPGSMHLFGRDKNAAQAKLSETRAKAPAEPKGMAPDDTLWPLPGEQGAITGRFGWTDDPATGRRRWNAGIEIAASPGTPVRAVLPGTVVYAGQRDGYGNTVVLEHKDGYRSYYGNLSQNSIRVGDRIRHGVEFATIAAQPSSPESGENSASLHFELKKGEMALNPESAIARSVTQG